MGIYNLDVVEIPTNMEMIRKDYNDAVFATEAGKFRAVVDELRRQPDLGDRLAYLTSLGGVCVVLYLVFTLTTPYYIGYALLVVYWAWAIRRYYLHRPSHLLCGVCRRSIPQKGRCPHCGAWNE